MIAARPRQGGQPGGCALAAELAHAPHQSCKRLVSQQLAGNGFEAEGPTGRAGDPGEVLGAPAGDGHETLVLVSAQLLDEAAGVDAHRAAIGAEPGRGAGVDALIVKQPGQLIGGLIGTIAAGQFPIEHDALARRQRQGARGADRLAKAALDTRIDDGIARRHGLEVGQVGLGVIVDDDAGIEQAIGVQQRLDAAHQRHPLRPPFQLHIGGHVAAGAVFGLERPAKAHRDQLRHRIHKGAVAGHLRRIIEPLGKDEVQVSLQRVAKDDGFPVFEAIEQLLQPRHPFGQTLDGKGDILDDDGGAGGAHRPHRREEPLANGPEPGAIAGKGHRGDLNELGRHGRHQLAAIHQLLFRFPMHLDKQGAGG